MDQPPRDDDRNEDGAASAMLAKMPLALAAGLLGAAVGAGLTVLASSLTGFYIPILPGYFAASAITRVWISDSIAVGVIGGVCGFVGGLFAEAFIYVNPGVLDYVLHFYENADGRDWLFRALNAGLGFWHARSRLPSAGSGFSAAGQAPTCPHCGQQNLAGARFCNGCGQQMT